MSGMHELFLVFRAVTGGATGNNLFNLNWAEFNGKGVTSSQTDTPGTVGGTVPATLSLTLGTPAAFGAFTPGVARTYDASTTANVISTAGDATLSVADPSPAATGRLVNGTFSLPQAAAGQGDEPGRHRRRSRTSAARPPDAAVDLRRTDVQRRGHGVVPAGDRRQRRAADGQLLEDADVHVVDDDTVSE